MFAKEDGIFNLVPVPKHLLKVALVCGAMAAGGRALALEPPAPVLNWVPGSSVKLEQIIGDVDWATGSNVTSRTLSRFNIEGTDICISFENGTNLTFLFGDTIGTNIQYHAADPMAWSATTNGEAGLLLNFYTNSAGSNVFVNPTGIDMSGDDTPTAGIVISNVTYLICCTGANHDGANIQQTHANDFSVLVTFDPITLSFRTNRIISQTANGGHFVRAALHIYGSNVMMFGEGSFRRSDIYLATIPTNSFLSGNGTLYFAGLTNGQPVWTSIETNAVPVVQDDPTNGPAWPLDTPSVGDLMVVNPPRLGLWLMTFDGGRRTTNNDSNEGVYFSYAAAPWGPWSAPQLIFNRFRDGAAGVYIYETTNHTGPAGPVINPSQNNPTNTEGAVYAPYLIERFTRITNSALFIYYTMATWNPYTVLKMRSQFTIVPVVAPASLLHRKNKFSLAWTGAPNESYIVQYSTNLALPWTTFTNVITSTNTAFNFTNDVPGGLPPAGYYRIRTAL